MIVAKCAVVKCDQCDTLCFLLVKSQKSQKYNVKVKDIKVKSKRHVSLLSKSKSCIIKSKTTKRQNSKAKEVVVLLMCMALSYGVCSRSAGGGEYCSCRLAAQWEACICCVSPLKFATSLPHPGCPHLMARLVNFFLGCIVKLIAEV